jgi:cytoskeletal protein CcmA (bactofilin family)
MGIFGSRRQPEPEPQETIERIPQQTPQPTLSSPQQPIGFETVLGTNSSLEGKFTSSSNVRIDGTFSGSLEINGNVLVGETAKINADIHAKNISIAGAVRGNVFGKKVQLLRTGRVWGDISATALTTEEGAFIDGKISMVSHEASAQLTPASSPAITEISSVAAMPETEDVEAMAIPDEPMSEPDFLPRDEEPSSEQ